MRVLPLLSVVLIFSAFGAGAQSVDWKTIGKPVGDDTPMRDRYVYFNESAVDKKVPVEKPVLISADIQEWLAQRVAEVMTLNGDIYEQKIAVNKRYFTEEGYKQYISGLIAAQVPKLLKEQHYNMSAVVLEPPNIIAQGLRENADKTRTYVWQLKVPVTLVYANLDGDTEYKVYLSAEIVRIPMRADGTLVSLNAWQFAAKP